jgi:hypothetical protein
MVGDLAELDGENLPARLFLRKGKNARPGMEWKTYKHLPECETNIY